MMKKVGGCFKVGNSHQQKNALNFLILYQAVW